jgi:hypothetical protein
VSSKVLNAGISRRRPIVGAGCPSRSPRKMCRLVCGMALLFPSARSSKPRRRKGSPKQTGVSKSLRLETLLL